MSFWQFIAAWNGYVAANSATEGKKLTEAEKDDLFAFAIAGTNDNARVLSTMTYWHDERGLVPWRRVSFTP